MENRNLLEARLKEKNITKEDLSKGLNMSYTSLQQRVKGRTDFKLGEIKKIKKILGLTNDQVIEIFFNE
jgi:predicted transcriptional regulator